MSDFEDAPGPGPPPLPPSPPPPSPPGPPGGRLGLVIRALGGLIGVLVIILVAVVATRGNGSGLTVAASTTVPPSTSQTAATTSNPPTTIPPTTSTAAVSSTAVSTTAITTITMVVLPSFVTQDCVAYDPATLAIEDSGADGWRLAAGLDDLLLFDTEADALVGLAIAGNHTELCFLGRGNTQPDPSRYVHQFWQGDSGVRVPVPGREDCLGYDPTNLSIENRSGDVWLLAEDDDPMTSFDGEADALAGLALAQAFSEHCYIGRGNERPERRLYIIDYWK